MRFKPIILFTAAALIFSTIYWSCSGPDLTGSSTTINYYDACSDPAPENPLIPVSYGRRMIYRFTGYDANGEIDTVVENFEYQVFREFYWFGSKWYEIGSCEDGCPDTDDFAYNSVSRAKNCSEGYCVGNSSGAYLIYKYPAEEGESYNSYPDGDVVITLVSKSVKVTVPLGVFTCYHYRYKLPGYDSVFVNRYVAPGIEMVKMLVYDEAADRPVYMWELKELYQ